MKRNLISNNQRAITLVALVITIIIILLLAGITLTLFLKPGGLFSRAKESKDIHSKAEADSDIELAKIAASISEDAQLKKNKLIEELHKLGITDSDIMDDGTSLKVKYKDYEYDISYNTILIPVNIAFHDYINDEDLSETTQIKVSSDTQLDDTTVKMPEGYALYSNYNSSITNPAVTIEDEKATEDLYTLQVCKISSDNEILLKNITGLNNVNLDLSNKYALDNDIDLSSIAKWTPIGWIDSDDVAFTGTFNGNGKTLSTLNCDYSSNSVTNV